MRERLYQTIYDDLLRKIKTGVYAQNDKLPTEHELMGLYGVSRVTAITALNLLRLSRYPTIIRCRGCMRRYATGRRRRASALSSTILTTALRRSGSA